jgi:DNA-binding NarL/FixJ family response regulator
MNEGVTLSGRELEILRLLVEGNCNKEVASTLGISLKTVETYRWRIKQKTNAHSLVHLVHYAIRHHIIELRG